MEKAFVGFEACEVTATAMLYSVIDVAVMGDSRISRVEKS